MNVERNEDALHAYVDGQLPAAERAAVEARLARDPEAAGLVASWTAQRQALKSLHAQVLHEPPPATLAQAGQHLLRRTAHGTSWLRWGGMAAAVLVAFALGWTGRGEWSGGAATLAARTPQDFARQALIAHAVYSPEVRHPVEVEAAQQAHLVQWLSRRLGRPLKVPVLSAAGYELVGGRLLPGEDGARAQFMYQHASGERITLYLGAVQGAAAKGMGETAFRYTSDGGVTSFYWTDGGFGYALSGKLPRAGMLSLAEAVYRQL